jgi:hypothetical protein
MPHRRMLFLFIIATLFPFSLYASPQAATNAQSTPTQQTESRVTRSGEIRIPSKHSALPAQGDFQAAPESADDQEHRRIREASFRSPDPDNLYKQLFPEIKDPGTKLVDGDTETTDLKIYDYAGGMIRTLPAGTSAAVIIGTVLSGKAYLFHDHSYVYTDYSIRIDEILKPDAAAGLVVGGQLVAYRPGGAIRFPAGHVRNVLNQGQGYPKVGSQYLFFLSRPDVNIREYGMTLFATYELSNGQVFPLDDGMDQYEGKSQAVLLDQVKKLIAASKNGDLQ